MCLLISYTIGSPGCSGGDVGEPPAEGAKSTGISRERVGAIRVGLVIDSLLTEFVVLRDEERTAIGGGDLDRFIAIAVNGDTVEVVPFGGRVRDIVLRSSRHLTAEGIGVGTTSTTMSRYQGATAQFSDAGLVVNLSRYCGTDFIFEGALGELGTVLTLDQLAELGESQRVSVVVVRACLPGQ
ncbi:MAG: hypothetical protein KF709_11230 [Gemmatimonadaceae bacterium]|nr:hypothetical protein [Gemmatimonadaceae bacterium]